MIKKNRIKFWDFAEIHRSLFRFILFSLFFSTIAINKYSPTSPYYQTLRLIILLAQCHRLFMSFACSNGLAVNWIRYKMLELEGLVLKPTSTCIVDLYSHMFDIMAMITYNHFFRKLAFYSYGFFEDTTHILNKDYKN